MNSLERPAASPNSSNAAVIAASRDIPPSINASSRARAVLIDQGIVTVQEDKVVAKVLTAAAMTYVAATIVAIMQMLYYASIVFGRRN